MLSFFPRGVLDEILNLIESVSEGFPSYSFTVICWTSPSVILRVLGLFCLLLLSSLLVVKGDIAVTILLRCSCVHVCVRPDLSGPQLLHLWMYFKIDTVVVFEEEKCHLKHFYP